MNKLPFEQRKAETIWKKKATGSYGRSPEERTTEQLLDYGIINIDKPAGPTSHNVAAFVQKILNIEKTGHSGTLDPMVTGCLPVAIGRATRVNEALLLAGKEYVCIMHVHGDLSQEKIKEHFQKFVGKIIQRPPKRSAVKREERERHVYYIDIIEIKGRDVLFRVGCEAGTYIRMICLHPETEIISNSIKSAKEFFENPELIYTMDNKKISKKSPSELQKFKFKGKLIRITMSSGIDFLITPEHRMLVSSEQGYVMKCASELKNSDYIVKSLKYHVREIIPAVSDLLDDSYLVDQDDIKDVVKEVFVEKYGSIRSMYQKLKIDRKSFLNKSKISIPISHIKKAGIYENIKTLIYGFKSKKGIKIKLVNLNSDLMYLAGLIASDGNNSKEKGTKRYTRIKFYNKDTALIKLFLRKYKKIFPKVNISKKNITNITVLDSSNSFLATICANLGIKSPEKNSDLFPLLNLNKKLIASFLRGYFDGDGSAYYKKKPNA
jgi:hypothetical protein